MISEDELDALALHILKLEARVEELGAALAQDAIDLETQAAFHVKEWLLYIEGQEALRKVVSLVLTEIPKGYGIGSAGQMIAISTAAAEAEIHSRWPVDRSVFKPVKRKPGKPDGD